MNEHLEQRTYSFEIASEMTDDIGIDRGAQA